MLFSDAHGCHRSEEMVRERGNFKSVYFLYVHNVHTVHEIERQADVGFSRKSILFARIVKELSIIHVYCM